MIGIIDYGTGNIGAFLNIYKRLHIPAKRIRNEDDFVDVSKLILPGVGAFDHAMNSFNNSGLYEIVEQKVTIEMTPVIGVCVGMQMLAHGSEEGKLKGLSWIPGIVKKFDVSKIPYTTRIPHMGWNEIQILSNSALFSDFLGSPNFYFLHSYYFECETNTSAIATSNYGGNFASAVNIKNVFGVQFHPEKSHSIGVKLLENFALMPC